jgi:hypothetical protein
MFIIIIFFLVRINIMRKKYTFIDQLMIEDTNPSNKRAWTQVTRKSQQFLLHQLNPSSYS